MKVLIVEDETMAYENLVKILDEIDPEIEIVGNAESIQQTIKWLTTKAAPDLILLDIHLSDGSAFNIFGSITVETPIIFTTAYDEYAIDAFKVNSIDYLLKPINVDDLRAALDKFKKWGKQDYSNYVDHINRLISSGSYSDRILIPLNDKLLPINLNDVSFFYTTENKTVVTLKTGKSYPYARRLDDIFNTLNPSHFYRANKQFIIAKESVKEITIWFDNRLLIRMETESPEKIYVPKNKAMEFKKWVV